MTLTREILFKDTLHAELVSIFLLVAIQDRPTTGKILSLILVLYCEMFVVRPEILMLILRSFCVCAAGRVSILACSIQAIRNYMGIDSSSRKLRILFISV